MMRMGTRSLHVIEKNLRYDVKLLTVVQEQNIKSFTPSFLNTLEGSQCHISIYNFGSNRICLLGDEQDVSIILVRAGYIYHLKNTTLKGCISFKIPT